MVTCRLAMKTGRRTSWLLKIGALNCGLLLSLFLPITAGAQPIADPQDYAARAFMKSLFDKDYNQA